jgi:hypothetical protein
MPHFLPDEEGGGPFLQGDTSGISIKGMSNNIPASQGDIIQLFRRLGDLIDGRFEAMEREIVHLSDKVSGLERSSAEMASMIKEKFESQRRSLVYITNILEPPQAPTPASANGQTPDMTGFAAMPAGGAFNVPVGLGMPVGLPANAPGGSYVAGSEPGSQSVLGAGRRARSPGFRQAQGGKSEIAARQAWWGP